MPINAEVLTTALVAMLDSPPAVAADEWAKAFITYAKISTPGAINPAVIEAQGKAIIISAIAPAIAAPAPDATLLITAIELSLIAFWMAAIPLCLPATPIVVATPTLAPALTAVFMKNQAAPPPVRYAAMKPVATAIDVWTHTILYGPVPPAVPSIPLT